jgi:hypothetical protein
VKQPAGGRRRAATPGLYALLGSSWPEAERGEIKEVPASRISQSSSSSSADWIKPLLQSERIGSVAALVPPIYDAYIRILHPPVVWAQKSQLHSTWFDTCLQTGRIAHPLMQWDSIRPVRRTNVEAPEKGSLAEAQTYIVCERLSGDGANVDQCYLAVWNGWAWIGSISERPGTPLIGEFAPDVEINDRTYLLFEAPLLAVPCLGFTTPWNSWLPRSPNLLWPESRKWFVATEVDLDSTILAGGSSLITRILNDPAIEAYLVAPGDSLTYDSDVINRSDQ